MLEHPSAVRREAIAAFVAVTAILFAFGVACSVTAGLEWPCEVDFFRDMGGAQALLDGFPGSDPAYAGEFNWFNPLQPALFAALAALTGLPLHLLYARCGPAVNLLGPIGFYLLARQLLGRWAALAALGAYLFLGNPAVPSWFQATYSPWAWPMDFAQGFFYLTAAAYVRAVLTRRSRWDVVTGVLLGITFMGHTAPTLIFVAMLFLLTACSQPGARREALRRLFVIGAVSLLVASPFLAPLLAHYRLHVQNHAPSEHEPIGLSFVLVNLLSLRAALAMLGLAIVLIWRAPTPRSADSADARSADRARAMILGGLFVAPVLLLGYGLFAQWLFHRGVSMPRVLPTYHFHLYVKAAESLLFGVGLVALAEWGVQRWRGRWWISEGGLAAGLATALAIAYLPGYLGGIELNTFRHESERIGADADRIALYRWLRSATGPDDVFLADPPTGIWAVSPADRKVVCMPDQYSNIYVNYAERTRANDQLFASLQSLDMPAFDALAARYNLTHVVVRKDAEPPLHRIPHDRFAADRFSLVFNETKYQVYRLR